MRIAMLGWEFPPFRSGGLGVHCYELTCALADMGHQIDFYMPIIGGKLIPPRKNIRILEVAETMLRPYFSITKKGQKATYGQGLVEAVQLYNKQATLMLMRMHKESQYDIIHGHDWLTVMAAGDSAVATGLPLVHTFHSTEFDRNSYPWDFVLDLERRGASQSTLLIGVSNRTRDQLLRLGADPSRVRVVYNGVDANKYAKRHNSDAIDRLRRQGKKIVLFLGRLTEQKGPVQFLHAAKKVLEKNKDIVFLIAGTGNLLPLLINMSVELGLQKNVRFLGFISDDDQRRIFSTCDLYVMPSTSEPFGIAALEAMASGIPVIISKTSGVSEVVKSAVKVDFWDINGMASKILAILSYPALRSTMVSFEKEDVSKLTWGRTARETVRVYDEAIALHHKSMALVPIQQK